MNRLTRLEQASAELKRALKAPGNDYLQGQALDAIRRHAFAAGEPVIDLLKRLFEREAAPQIAAVSTNGALREGAVPETFSKKCRGCNDTFLSQKAWNGHGESRCMKKNGKGPSK